MVKYFCPPAFGFLAVAGILVMSESSRAAVVLDQIGNVNFYQFGALPGAQPSQICADFSDYQSMVLEDFTVSSDDLRITNVSALFLAIGGYERFADVPNYALAIFSDVSLAGSTLTGNVANLVVVAGGGASVIQVIDSGSTLEYGLVSLNVDFQLPAAGTYWFGVAPISDIGVGGMFMLVGGDAAAPGDSGNSDARLANPGEGLGGPLSVLNGDYAYSVTAVPEPTALMFSMMCCVTGLCFRNRKSST